MKYGILLLFGLLAVSVSAVAQDFEFTYNDNTLTYSVIDSQNHTVALKRGLNDYVTGILDLPSELIYQGEKYTLTTIDNSAFESNIGIFKVIIPGTVTTVGNNAFRGCYAIGSVDFGTSLINIGDNAFNNCTELTEIILPSSVENIGLSVFGNCSKLINIRVSSDSQYFVSEDGVLYNKAKTVLKQYPAGRGGDYVIPENVTDISGAFCGCKSLKSVSIPNSTTTIGDYTFFNCKSLTEIKLPENVLTIGSGAFYSCSSLSSINIPDQVTDIKAETFKYCSSLENLNLPDKIRTIGNQAFYFCTKLSSIKIPDEVISIGDSAFYYCFHLGSITLGNSVRTIGAEAFYYCGMGTITIPASVTEIGNVVFGLCRSLKNIEVSPENQYFVSEDGVLFNKEKTSLIAYPCAGPTKYIVPSTVTNITGAFTWAEIESIELPASLIIIGDRAFEECYHLASITIPDSVEKIGEKAFYSCWDLKSINIPNSVTSIGDMAFNECISTSSIILGSSVAEIGDIAFYSWGKLKTIHSYNEVPPVCTESTFAKVPADVLIYVPVGSKEQYMESIGWNKFTNIIEMDNIPEGIGFINVDPETDTVGKDIYTIGGVCVKHNAAQTDIDALAPGIYIIGGKKTLVNN